MSRVRIDAAGYQAALINYCEYADKYAMPTMRSKGLISLERTAEFVGIVTSLQGKPAVHQQADKPPSAHHADGFDPSPLS